ncbi:MAG: hypothetical protein IIY70_00100 [Oscillospiraceae bacterium]|nr:hypothetical protein [Oscillospiraceae bacterium]
MIFTKEWLRAALARAAKTVAQTAVGLIPAAASISQIDWKTVLSCSLLSGLVSLLTSLAGLPEVSERGDK